MKRLTGLLLFCAVASTLGLKASGMTPIVPTTFLLGFALTMTPLAWAVSSGLTAIERRCSGYARWFPAAGATMGVLFLLFYGTIPLIDAVILVALVTRLVAGPIDRSMRTVGLALIAFLFMNIAVRDCNYLAVSEISGRLHDAVLRSWDEWLFSRLLGAPVQYVGLFPLVSDGLLHVLENAYFFFFPELLVVIFVLAGERRALSVYLTRLTVCYVLALGMFLVWPIVGPELQYPSSFKTAYESTATFQLMHSTYREFAAVREGMQPITGFGYFIGLPSLHAAVGLLGQISVRRARLCYWFLLPINVALIISTVLLGYHYVTDVVAGLLLVPVAIGVVELGCRFLERQPRSLDIRPT